MIEPKDINVLIGCEESQTVCIAFRERGFNAFSCDIQDCSGGHPEWHFQEDIFEVLKREKPFDLGIFHPPCTYLTVTANRYSNLKEQARKTVEPDWPVQQIPAVARQDIAQPFVAGLLPECLKMNNS